MKKLMLGFVVVFALGCGVVHSDTALGYAKRAHAECKDFSVLAHRMTENSLTEIQMTCGEIKKSITVKCQFGWGLIADTVCHENN
jgi:hypothetical protein